MSDIINTIKQRRSIRNYQNTPVPKELLEPILEAGMYAPSALNKQPWRFIVITNPNTITKLSRAIRRTVKSIYKRRSLLKLIVKQLRDPKSLQALQKTAETETDTIFYNAPVVILVIADQNNSWAVTDCALAAQNMMLAAHSLGLGTCFIGRAKLLHYHQQLCTQLHINRNQRIYAALALGYPEAAPLPVPDRKNDTFVRWVT